MPISIAEQQLLERLGGDQIVSNSTDMVSFLEAALTL